MQALAPVNYFFALFANALCVATHIKQHVPLNEENFSWLFDVQPFPWPALLRRHFVCPAGEGNTVEIRTSIHERVACIDAMRENFASLKATSDPNMGLHWDNIELCLASLQEVIDKGTPAGNPFATIIEKASRVLDPPVRSNSKAIRNNRLTGTDEIVQELLSELIGETRLPPYLVSKLGLFVLRLSSPISLSELYFGQIFGPYYVVRKARSAVTDVPGDRNLLVRDMMWIRPLDGNPSAQGHRSDNPARPTVALGYYVSAIDKQVFEITHIAVRNDVVMLDAVAYLDGTETKSICVYLPEMLMQARQQVDFASIIGTLRDQSRTGAWSALVTRPDLVPDEMLGLHYALIFFADAFSMKNFGDKAENYDPLINKVFWALCYAQHCGVIYSQDWEEKARQAPEGDIYGVALGELLKRKEAFEACFKYSKRHMKVVEDSVDSLIKEMSITQDGEVRVSRSKLKNFLVEMYTKAEQTAINPTSVRGKEKTFKYFSNPKTTPALPYHQD